MSYADLGTAVVRRRGMIVGSLVGAPATGAAGAVDAVLNVADAIRFVKIIAGVAAVGILLGYTGHLVLGPPKR